jgi:hypothetical protein
LKHVLVIMLFGLASITGCTGFVEVPASDYDNLDSAKADVWKITTKSEASFEARRFTVTDTTLVIETLVIENHRGRSTNEARPEDRSLPITLERSEVVKIEQQKTEVLGPTAIIILGGALLLGIAAWIALANSGPWF